MTDYAYDLHPRDDPRDGAAIIRYTAEDLIAAEFRDAIGVGSGQGIIWHDHDGAENIDSRGEQYVRVVRLGGTEKVVGGFWTSKLPFETAVASERRHLTFSGPGQMAYLARARMAPHTYIHDVFTGQDPFDGIWRLSAQSTIFANGPYLGAMLWRVIYEAQHFRSGSSTYTHRHKDGLEYTDNHDDDRTVSRIPDLVLGFDQFEDSNGNAWTLTAGEFSAQVGESVLGVVQRLMQAGLSVWMDPDTFTLYAWEGRPATKLGRSTDRTGAAWGTNVVRFQSPTDGTIDTGNILSDANRVVNAYLPQGPIWVGGNDIYHREPGPSDALYEGFLASTVEDLDALAQIGAAQSTAREEASDVGDLHHRLGDSPSTGAYLPGEHYLLDELVRINTGSGEFDYTEANYPVAAWRVSLPAGAAQWEAFAELGASFQEGRERQFTIPSNPGHTHPPNPELCRPGTVVEAELYEFWTWESGSSSSPDHPGSLALGAAPALWGEGGPGLGTPGGGAEGSTGYSNLLHDGGSTDLDSVPGETYTFSGWFYAYNTDVRIEVIWFDADGGDELSRDLIVYNAGWPEAWTFWEGSATAPTGAVHMQLKATTQASGGVGATGWVDQVRIYGAASGTSTAGDGHPDLIGVGVRAKRCDDKTHVSRDRPPSVSDDWSLGYRLFTVWHQVDDVDDPTEIIQTWVLFKNEPDDAAVWLAWPGSTSSGGGSGPSLTVSDHGPMDTDEEFSAAVAVHVGVMEDDLAVTLTGVTPGQGAYLTARFTQDSTGGHSIDLGSVLGAPAVEAALDQTANAVNILQFFYDGTDWYVFLAGGGGSSVGALDDLSDVTITTPAEGDLLRYDGSAWVNEAATASSGHYELLMTGSSPPEPLEDGTGNDWLYVWVND